MQDENTHAKVICGAKTRAGTPCQNAQMANGRCRMHGGKAKKGAELPQFKDGRHSKYMPKELIAIYQETQGDTDLLSVRHEIALVDTLIMGLLPKLGTGESGKAWETIKKLIKDVRRSYQSESLGAMMEALADMEDLANQNILHYETQKEIKDSIDTRRKLVETETKISMQNERAISVEQLMLLMAQVLNVIQTVVTDEKQKHAIAIKLQGILSLP